MTMPAPVAPPGAAGRRRLRPRIDWELIACGLHGHHLVGTGAAEVRPEDHALVRERDGVRWHRCLRCDAWVPLAARLAPMTDRVPSPTDIEVPLRGSALRDRFVLRIIAVERVLHVVVLGLLIAAVFVFAADRRKLHNAYTRVLADLQGTFGGTIGRQGILADINKLFNVSTGVLYLIGIALCVYTAVLILETVGLWFDRRWAEYLTFVETCVFVPYEVYELAHGVTALKVVGLLLNLAILVYLAAVHRLFGVRGGVAALAARRAESNGWDAIAERTPATVPPPLAPASAPPGAGSLTGR